MKLETHIDGTWLTSRYTYKARKILIKSRKGYGMKAHCFLYNSDKVDFTLRYSYVSVDFLLNKVKQKIDKNET